MYKLKNLLKQYKEEFDLNLREGLIKTTPIGKTLDILKRKFPTIKWGVSSKNNISLRYTKKEYLDWGELLKYINNLGWFGSIMSFKDIEGRNVRNIQFNEEYLELNLIWISITFEAKYDFTVDKIPDKLYHLTPLTNWDKIKKIGLIPKSRSKASFHPERIYFTKTPQDAERLGSLFYQKSGVKEFVLIEIYTSYSNNYLKLYEDPNYVGGYYTLNNIPPISLTKVKEIKLPT